MRLRSIARKVSYVLVGALGTYVVERLPSSSRGAEASRVEVPEPEEPSGAPFVHSVAHAMRPARPDANPQKLLLAFDGSGTAQPAVRCAADGFDVLELGPNYRAVHHSFVDCMLDEQSRLMRNTRVVPVMKDGRTTGVKLFGVRPGDALFKLGFRNGDELRDVNEMDVTDPSHALEAYARLRENPNLSAGVLRNGQLVRLRFVIC